MANEIPRSVQLGVSKSPEQRLKKGGSSVITALPPSHLVPLPLERMYGAMFKRLVVTVLCLATISSASLTDCKL